MQEREGHGEWELSCLPWNENDLRGFRLDLAGSARLPATIDRYRQKDIGGRRTIHLHQQTEGRLRPRTTDGLHLVAARH